MKNKIIGTIILIIAIGLVGLGFLVDRDLATSHSDSSSGSASSDKQTSTADDSLLKNMTEADVTFDSQKINIYLFWGEGCPHCKNLAKYLQEITPEHQQYFNLFTFEIYNSQTNRELMERVAEKLNEQPSGVPFLVIGDQSWTGYRKDMNASIEQAISQQSAKTDRIDILKQLSSD